MDEEEATPSRQPAFRSQTDSARHNGHTRLAQQQIHHIYRNVCAGSFIIFPLKATIKHKFHSIIGSKTIEESI